MPWHLRTPTRTHKTNQDSLDKLTSVMVSTAGVLRPVAKSPDEQMGELFDVVQQQQVYADGKTFVDMIPKQKAKLLMRHYDKAKVDGQFDLHRFVSEHFEGADIVASRYVPDETTSARQHVTNLWPVLRRRARADKGSLIALPYDYIVPGGRFSEQFYWDSYFIMLGLAADEEWTTILGMVRNYAHMLRKFGMIPTANRTYFLSRSQPPFFVHMVQLLATHRGRTRTYSEFLPALLTEYRFWMKGKKQVDAHPDSHAYARLVRMPDGSYLNRYYDDKTTPRPESRREDIETAQHATSERREKVYLDLRAAAESGWDFSSRWFRDAHDIGSIHASDMVAVDLNCLLYQLEHALADTYALLKQPLLATRFRRAAERRGDAVRQYCWDSTRQFFTDYDFETGHPTGRLTLAGVFPLYARIATSEQAAAVAARIEQEFLKDGGLVTTSIDNNQQWDAPNGWAPLQWIAIQGLREYGYHDLATQIRDRWLATNEAVYAAQRKMVEKYDVMHGLAGGGGEYPLQDGFGWTNGVYAALYDERMVEYGK